MVHGELSFTMLTWKYPKTLVMYPGYAGTPLFGVGLRKKVREAGDKGASGASLPGEVWNRNSLSVSFPIVQ